MDEKKAPNLRKPNRFVAEAWRCVEARHTSHGPLAMWWLQAQRLNAPTHLHSHQSFPSRAPTGSRDDLTGADGATGTPHQLQRSSPRRSVTVTAVDGAPGLLLILVGTAAVLGLCVTTLIWGRRSSCHSLGLSCGLVTYIAFSEILPPLGASHAVKRCGGSLPSPPRTGVPVSLNLRSESP